MSRQTLAIISGEQQPLFSANDNVLVQQTGVHRGRCVKRLIAGGIAAFGLTTLVIADTKTSHFIVVSFMLLGVLNAIRQLRNASLVHVEQYTSG